MNGRFRGWIADLWLDLGRERGVGAEAPEECRLLRNPAGLTPGVPGDEIFVQSRQRSELDTLP